MVSLSQRHYKIKQGQYLEDNIEETIETLSENEEGDFESFEDVIEYYFGPVRYVFENDDGKWYIAIPEGPSGIHHVAIEHIDNGANKDHLRLGIARYEKNKIVEMAQEIANNQEITDEEITSYESEIQERISDESLEEIVMDIFNVSNLYIFEGDEARWAVLQQEQKSQYSHIEICVFEGSDVYVEPVKYTSSNKFVKKTMDFHALNLKNEFLNRITKTTAEDRKERANRRQRKEKSSHLPS